MISAETYLGPTPTLGAAQRNQVLANIKEPQDSSTNDQPQATSSKDQPRAKPTSSKGQPRATSSNDQPQAGKKPCVTFVTTKVIGTEVLHCLDESPINYLC